MVAAIIFAAVFLLQLILGASMIATASVAATRHLNAGNRAFDVVLRALGWSTAALGVWCIFGTLVLVTLMQVRGPFDPDLEIMAALGVLYFSMMTFGGWLQTRLAGSSSISSSPADQRKRDRRITMLRVVGWTYLVMPLAPTAWVYLALTTFFFGNIVRIQQESLLLILAVAVRSRSPLADEVEALADASRGRFRRRLRDLAERLRNGQRLSEALADLPGLVPPQSVTAIRVGEELGNLVPVLQDESLRLDRREQAAVLGRVSAAGIAFYICTVLTVMTGIVSYLLYAIMPKFKKIYQDFGMQTPYATDLLIAFANAAMRYFPLVMLGAAILFAWPAFLFFRNGGWAGFDWRFFSALYPRLETPGILRSLAHAIAGRRPLAAAVGGLEVHHRRRHIRKRMRKMKDGLLRGEDCVQLLRRYGLINSREMAALVAAERVGNLPWALEGVADAIDRRHRAAAQRFVEMAQPAIVCVLGLVVFVVCIGFFLPLVHLIEANLAGY